MSHNPEDHQDHHHDHANHGHGHGHGHPSHNHMHGPGAQHRGYHGHHPSLEKLEAADKYAAANRTHFNASAAHYDSQPHIIEVTSGIVEAILRTVEFDEEKTSVMEFACGTGTVESDYCLIVTDDIPGLVSQGLAPFSKVIVGVDISESMVEHYNLRVSNQGISFDEMKAVCTELKGTDDELDGMKFDVIVVSDLSELYGLDRLSNLPSKCSQAYHHFSSIKETTRILTSFLKPGTGVLLVIDLVKGKNTLHTSPHASEHVRDTVAHRGGFNTDEIRDVFELCGLQGVEVEPAFTYQEKFELFIAKGVRPAA